MAYTIPDHIGGFDNDGLFQRVENWVADKEAGIKILAERMDAECDNFAEGFNNCITRDLKGKPNVDFDFNGNCGINLKTDLVKGDSASSIGIVIKDPTRLFYDISEVPNSIVLHNSYLNTLAINSDDSYHFFMVVKQTITSQDFTMMFFGTTILANREIVGSSGDPLTTSPMLLAGSIHECVLFTDTFGIAKIAILTAGIGGGGGGGGRVDIITSIDETIDVDDSDKSNVDLSVNKKAVVGQVVRTINDIAPDEDGDFGNVLTFSSYIPPTTVNVANWNSTLSKYGHIVNYNTYFTVVWNGSSTLGSELDFGARIGKGVIDMSIEIGIQTQLTWTFKNAAGLTYMIRNLKSNNLIFDETCKDSTFIFDNFSLGERYAVMTPEPFAITVNGYNIKVIFINNCNFTDFDSTTQDYAWIGNTSGYNSSVLVLSPGELLPNKLGWFPLKIVPTTRGLSIKIAGDIPLLRTEPYDPGDYTGYVSCHGKIIFPNSIG